MTQDLAGTDVAHSSTQASPQPPATGRTPERGRFVPVTLTALWTVLNTWWSFSRVDDRALNIDEAGYLAFAANHAYGFAAQGWTGWLDSVLAASQHAPGVPVLTSLLAIVGVGIDEAGLLVVGLSAGVMLLFSWLLVRDVVGRTAGWCAAILLATAPAVLNFSHLYTFVLPTAALLAVALYAAHRARCASSLRWSLVLGVVLGCLPLVRSMNFAFAGIIGLILLSQASLVPGGRARALRNVAFVATLAAIVLAPWLSSSWRLVAGYLFGFGYGDRAQEFGASGGSALAAALRLTAINLFAVHTTVIFLGVLLAMAAALLQGWTGLRAMGPSRVGRWARIVQLPVFPAAAMTVLGFAALGTTANAGSGFGFQLAPAFVAVASHGWSWAFLRPAVQAWRPLRPLAVSTLLVVCAVPALDLVARNAPWGALRTANFPAVGPLEVVAGDQFDESYLTIVNGDAPLNSPAWSKDWRDLSDELAKVVAQHDLVASSVAFGFRGYFVNANTVQLEVLRDGHWAVPVVQLEPAVIEGSEESYREWLSTGAAASVCHLFTSRGEVNEFKPMVDTVLMEQAARSVGFEVTDSLMMPDGRSLDTWQRRTPECDL